MPIDSNTATVLLTRFNVKTGVIASPKIHAIDWLLGRLNLFESVTLPAISAQTRPPDAWLVFFDEGMPDLIQDRIRALREKFSYLHPVYCAELSSATYKAAIQQHVSDSAQWLISTRIDNDDAIHPSLLEQVYDSAHPGRREFINPLHGLIVAGPHAFRKRDASSPFISLSEPMTDFKTVWIDQHQRLKTHGTVRQLRLPDAWIQLVHGGNIANQVRGLRARYYSIDMRILPHALRSQLQPESFLQLCLDNSLGAAVRYARSAGRRIRRLWSQ